MPTETPVQTVTVPGPRRALASLIWGLIRVVTVLAGVSAGGAAAAGLGQAVTGHAAAPAAVLAGLVVGAVAGAAAGLLASRGVPGWLQERRLRRLRTAGPAAVSVRATVDRLDRPRRPARHGLSRGRYVVHVSWLDQAAGVGFRGERCYRMAGRRSRRLEALCVGRAQVAVYYPARRPSQFVIDVPFAPTMADLFG
jgi:hypothetical protein